MLRHLPPAPGAYPDLLVGLQAADDAAVWRLDAERALVQTVDFFTPIVDDAYTYGAIAAANSLSDVYAMGGEPFLALAIAAFPDSLPQDLLAEIVRGARDKAAEAGVVIAGGHTVVDDEPKYGLCVTGLVHPERILTKGAARPGDTLYLTKPLGTGVIATALKKERAAPQHVEGAVQSMLRLNRDAARLLRDAPGGARRDRHHRLRPPRPRLRDGPRQRGRPGDRGRSGALPPRRPGVRRGRPPPRRGRPQPGLPGGGGRQRGPRLTVAPGVDPVRAAALFDPQTSGGLLFAAPQGADAALEGAFREAGQPLWAIGRCAAGHGVRVV